MLTSKFEELKKFLLEIGKAEFEELQSLTISNTYNESYETFEIMGNEYKVLTDTEADEETKKQILDSLWAFNADFILQHTEFYKTSSDREDTEFVNSLKQLQGDICESANSIVKALIIDIDAFVEDAIDADGRGHFISYYDGEEIEQDDFYIYRTN